MNIFNVSIFRKLIFTSLAALAIPAQAGIITIDLVTTFSGTTPEGTLTATFDDTVDINTVRLTMDATNLGSGEFVDGVGDFGWGFNFNPNKTLSELSFNFSGGNDADSISTGENAFKADGDGTFDILFLWDPDPLSRLNNGQTSVYDITGIDGLVADDFDFFSNPEEGNGTTWKSAAKVQGIGEAGEESGFLGGGPGPGGPGVGTPIPEPGMLSLLGIGLLGMGLARRRRHGS